MISQGQLEELDARQRAALLRRLVALQPPPPVPRNASRGRRQFLIVVTATCLGLIPWLVLLGITLPHRYVAQNWAVTWIGFDVGLLACLATTAVLAYLRRQTVIVMAFITGTLLLCDAWFDVVTASGSGDFSMSLASAVLFELPLAALLFGTAVRLLRTTVERAQVLLMGGAPGRVRLNRLPLFGVPVHSAAFSPPVERSSNGADTLTSVDVRAEHGRASI